MYILLEKSYKNRRSVEDPLPAGGCASRPPRCDCRLYCYNFVE